MLIKGYVFTGADTNTLDLIVDLMCAHVKRLRYLLIVGAYRDNEVTEGHPLTHTINRLRGKRVQVSDLELVPLTRQEVIMLLEDSFTQQGTITIFIHTFTHSSITNTNYF